MQYQIGKCVHCGGEGKRKLFEDRDPVEGYKLVDKKTCPDCNGTAVKEYIARYPCWKQFTDTEKGALLLAHLNGEEIESWAKDENIWTIDSYPGWYDEVVYRVKPKPKIEKITLFGTGATFTTRKAMNDTHTITINKIDGVIDCSSIVMSRLLT